MRNTLILLFIFFGSINLVGQQKEKIPEKKIITYNLNDSLEILKLSKLKQEVKQLQSENKINPIVKIIPAYGGVFAALVAVIGAVFSYYKYNKEKHIENEIRLESRFNSVINNLSSDNPSLQASAAVSLLTFLKPKYSQFHNQVYLILLANLKIGHNASVNALIVQTFEKAIRLYIQSNRQISNTLYLDLTRINLYGINLSGLNLQSVDLAFSNLQNANLVNCNLEKARGYKVNLSGARLSRANLREVRFNKSNCERAKFHDTNLVSAKLQGSNLVDAQFHQAKLQEANFDECHIRGANFVQANLNNTFLRKIKFRDEDLKNLLKSKNMSWQKSNLDNETKERIQVLNSSI